jgi:hypothetical protein
MARRLNVCDLVEPLCERHEEGIFKPPPLAGGGRGAARGVSPRKRKLFDTSLAAGIPSRSLRSPPLPQGEGPWFFHMLLRHRAA